MKPPLNQIANLVSKVEISWPAILPLPRLAPLMNKVASHIPNLPLPSARTNLMDINTPVRGTRPLSPGLITDIEQVTLRRTLAETPRVSEPIFESVVESGDRNITQGLIPLSFE